MQIEIRGAERLSFRERQVVVLKEMNQTNKQIAKKLGLSASTVATLYSRARAKGYQVVILLGGDVLGLFNDDDEMGGDSDAGETDET